MIFAIIGMGRAGRRWQRIAEAQGYGVIGYDARQHTGSPLIDELLQAVDAAIIATPPNKHHGWASAVVGVYGRPVLVEKPISDQVLDWPAEHALIMPVTSYRFHPQVWMAKFEYQEGDSIEVIYREPIEEWQAETYERDADLEARIHFVDLLYWFGGAALARQHRKLVHIDYLTKGERFCRLTVNGKPFDLIPSDAVHTRQLQHFVECIKGESCPVCTIAEANEILELTLT